MLITIQHTKTLAELKWNTIKRLDKLRNSYKNGTAMAYFIRDRFKEPIGAFIARDTSGRIVGWLAYQRLNFSGSNWSERYIDLHVFVDPKFRHRGIAKLLVDEALTNPELRKLKRRFEVPFVFDPKAFNRRD